MRAFLFPTILLIALIFFANMASAEFESVQVDVLESSSDCGVSSKGIDLLTVSEDDRIVTGLSRSNIPSEILTSGRPAGTYLKVYAGQVSSGGYHLQLTSQNVSVIHDNVILPLILHNGSYQREQAITYPCAVIWIESTTDYSFSLPGLLYK